MANGTCINCGKSGPVHRHHPDKEKWPNFTVPLCHECHRDTHSTILVFFSSKAHEGYKKWLEETEAKENYISLKERVAKYKELEFDEYGQHRWW